MGLADAFKAATCTRAQSKGEDNLRTCCEDYWLDDYEDNGCTKGQIRIDGVEVGTYTVSPNNEIVITNDDEALEWAIMHNIPQATTRSIDMGAMTEEEQDKLYKYVKRNFPHAYREKTYIAEHDLSKIVKVNLDGEIVGVADGQPAEGFCVVYNPKVTVRGCKAATIADVMEQRAGKNLITDVIRSVQLEPVYELPEKDGNE